MEHHFKQLCNCLSQISQLETLISSNILSFPEVKAIMDMVDLKRRGFLDLNDVFELVGKVTEKELFDVFKFLDKSRTGEIRLEELQAAIGNPESNSKNTAKEYLFPRFYKIVDTVKDKPKKIVEIKEKYSLTGPALKGVFKYICELVHSKYVSQQELMDVIKTQFIKNQLKWTVNCQNVVKDIFSGQNISEAKFVEALACKGKSMEDEEECLLKGISENPTTGYGNNQSLYARLKLSGLASNTQTTEKTPTFQRKTNNFLDTSDYKSPNRQEKLTRSPSTNDNTQFKSKFDQIQNSITSVLQNIQQRRDRLRQDSQQRKKLIQDVMQRKKQLYNNASEWGESATGDWAFQKDLLQRGTNASVKKVAKSYLNHNPTYYQSPQAAECQTKEEERYQSFKRSVYQTEKPIVPNEGSSISYERSCGHAKNVTTPSFAPYEPLRRPSTPTGSTDISQILKKYSPNISEAYVQPQSQATLKALCKSKSGFIYENGYTPSSQIRESNYRQSKEDQYENFGLSRGGYSSSTSKLKDNYKENVMRRAEEEAAKKIEEIERKARMKVLEKKGGFRNRPEVEWSRTPKQSINF